jgi:ubiquinone/menaquinone biosynthesis C-methylase UbiE
MYDPQWVRDYYDADGIGEWGRFDLHPVLRLAFAVHCHYLQEYIAPADRVLEIGAGCGRFTQVLAGIAPRITVADISPVQLMFNRQQAETLGFAPAVEGWVECDICDLRGHFADETFDTVVCYGGALSYVFDRAEQALQELQSVVKPGGVLFLEVMSLWGTIHHALTSVLAIPQELTAGAVLSENWADALREVPEDSETWHYLLEMELEACREPGCLDLGTHLIAVCRRAG